jgi:hypothetical protein
MTQKKPNVEEIEAAMGRYRKRQLGLAQLQFDDARIKELLHEKTIIERDSRGIMVLQSLRKYGEIPGPVMKKLLGSSGHSYSGEGFLASMIREGYVDVSPGMFDGHRVKVLAITPKGRQALKGHKK